MLWARIRPARRLVLARPIRQHHGRRLAEGVLRQLDVQGQLRGRHRVHRDPPVDTKGLQLTKPGDHAMVAYVQMGMSGWVWTSPGVRVVRPAAWRIRSGSPSTCCSGRAGLRLGRGRHHRAVESRGDVLRRASRHRRRGDLRPAGYRARRCRQRDAVQVPRHAPGGEAPPGLAPGSADELPRLLHVLVRQAQDRRARELLRGRGVHIGNIVFNSASSWRR